MTGGRRTNLSNFEVTDTGPGIIPEERSRAFERFYRLPDTEQEGSGLGLSIVQRIAELHAAFVTLNAGPEGRGLKVTVTFPALQHSS